ncbi:hypothetical protein EYD45_01660 [Hyunsoonleella flava]|uniref:Anti-sigma K factor RskA C-terminal domain-containing protein n=1 Tax=Hyunsoonleella flava TaxID=2527939 RepID=A0A4Q9FLJ5_9FLAO|nr:anti-sigma factor [Hyunsoonleella flava]TBN06617.1 hypothetical protein EYD45_01660 [Hyunsoonleella flava]
MMDKAYILENGIIEQYLLGELSAEDELSLERLLAEDEELMARFKTIEASFESLAFENAVNPPKQVKERLMNSVKGSETKVVSLPKQNPFKNYLAMAASVAAVLLIGSIWMYSQLNKTNKQLQIVEEQNSQLLEDLNGLKGNLETTTAYLDILNSAETKQYILKGNALSPEAKVVSYVNHKQKSVIVNTVDLPKLDNAHNYQMWADVDGEMINMGVIKKDGPLLAMNYIEDAASLNITIEPAGGSDHPTVSRLITNVYL